MTSQHLKYAFLCAVSLASSMAAGRGFAAESPLGPSCLAITPDGKTLVVGCHDSPRLIKIDLLEGEVLAEMNLAAPVTGVALNTTGRRAYVTCAGSPGAVLAIDLADWKVTAEISAGNMPIAPVLAKSEDRLYVCNRFDDDVSVIELEEGRQVSRIPVVRQPVAAALTRDGRLLAVANHLPLEPADGFLVRSAVTLIATQSGTSRTIPLADGSTGLRDIRITADDRYAVVTHLVGNFDLVASHLEEGWMNTNAFSVIDLATGELRGHALLDDQYQGSANPWGVAFSEDGQSMFVVHSGSHELSVLPMTEVIDKSQRKYEQRGPLGRPAYLQSSNRKIPIPGDGPRALAATSGLLCVSLYFSDAVAVLSTPVVGRPRWSTIRLGPKPEPTQARYGEMLFHDGRLCFQHWQSCSSCHPDGRSDGLNWDLLNDGAGNRKNTKSLLLAHKTPPSMATAARDSAEVAVRSGMKHILFMRPDESVALAIDAYLESLRPMPSPRLVAGKLSSSARRGARVFGESGLGCVRCHSGPLYTDQHLHVIGTPDELGADRFDTPTLAEVWRTAPYLHHGRYTSVRSLLAEGRHGISPAQMQELSNQELDDLIEYVLSL